MLHTDRGLHCLSLICTSQNGERGGKNDSEMISWVSHYIVNLKKKKDIVSFDRTILIHEDSFDLWMQARGAGSSIWVFGRGV